MATKLEEMLITSSKKLAELRKAQKPHPQKTKQSTK